VEKDKRGQDGLDGLDGTNSPRLVPLGREGRGRIVWTDSDRAEEARGSEMERREGGKQDRKEGQKMAKSGQPSR
jgi:hypothetical protein